MSEALKAQLVEVDTARSMDALAGWSRDPMQDFTERATVGPFYSSDFPPSVRSFLGDPKRILVATCGRNEHGRGNLAPVLEYSRASIGTSGSLLYVDADSTDESMGVARDLGVTAIRRGDILPDLLDRRLMSQILAIDEATLEGKEVAGDPPLRKGTDILLIRAEALRRRLLGEDPDYIGFIDSDLKSIPGGSVADQLSQTDSRHIYYPLEIMVAGLNAMNRRRPENMQPWAIFTGSEKRNNEPVFGMYNMAAVAGTSPFLHEDQREIARAFFTFPGTIVHPLTGELMVSADEELSSMGATGTCIETARALTLAGRQLEAYGTTDPKQLRRSHPLVGNVRRGLQQRIDEPQLDEKEWWMIAGVIPQFAEVITSYSIQTRRLPHQYDLEDYEAINRWLASINSMSQLDGSRQTRRFDSYPMERAIPPVTLLHKEGLLKIA